MLNPTRLILLLSLLIATSAAAYDFPSLTGRVVDQAGLLSESAQTELTALLASHEDATTNQVVIATINSLDGADIDDYGVQLAREWAIGQKGKDNGVVLLIAKNDRKMRIDVGYGLEGTLTDAICSIIIDRRLRPAFKAGDFEGGIKAGVNGIIDVLNNEMPEDLKKPAASISNWSDSLIPVMFFIFVISQFFRRGKNTLIPAIAFGTIGGITAAILANSLLVGAIAGGVLFVLILVLKGGGSGGGGSSSGWSSSSSSWSSSSGGFSGGGGSFGGGGASGGW